LWVWWVLWGFSGGFFWGGGGGGLWGGGGGGEEVDRKKGE